MTTAPTVTRAEVRRVIPPYATRDEVQAVIQADHWLFFLRDRDPVYGSVHALEVKAGRTWVRTLRGSFPLDQIIAIASVEPTYVEEWIRGEGV